MSDTVDRPPKDAAAWHELKAYGELLVYYIYSETPDLTTADRLDLARAARDVVLDLKDVPNADDAVRGAFRDARHGAKCAGESVARWPKACPWGVDWLLKVAEQRIRVWSGGPPGDDQRAA